MASTASRASGLSADSNHPGEFSDNESEMDDLEEQQLIPNYEDTDSDPRTPLDKTIDRIGMGSYQWILLSLCGFGWMADNMWLQGIAIILPRVQQHYSVPDSYIGTMSSTMFAGMMFGAVGWGTCSDLMGRSTAFNATLFFTSLFGLLASFANSFTSLCIVLFLLGSAVGGSMPTDGTLLLEHMPQEKQYLVTALSVFFSFGAVLSAVVALLVVPQHSCLPSSDSCDVELDNKGWKYMLITLGLITLSMFLARMVFFRLHESPRYLVHAGRPQEALESLQLISRFNGSDLELELGDVEDHHQGTASSPPREDGENGDPNTSSLNGHNRTDSTDKDYHATGESLTALEDHAFPSDASEHPTDGPSDIFAPVPASQNKSKLHDHSTNPKSRSPLPRPRPPSLRPRPSRSSSRNAVQKERRMSAVVDKKLRGVLPRWIRRPLLAWLDRVAMVLSPEWFKTTVIVWSVWCLLSLGYTMFNVFLPRLLESTANARHPRALMNKSLEDSLWDLVVYTIGGCPGALLGAWMIESSLGRRWSLAGSTFVTAIMCVCFVLADAAWTVRLSTVGISLSATAMWAVLYGWTPEIFGTKVRGTACGIASALSRVGGMIAPMLGGMLLMIDRSVPVYTSVVVFAIAGILILLLRESAGDGNRGRGSRSLVH